jgi:arabinogalactan oligomer/maltooligosaccharide transport system permease protein
LRCFILLCRQTGCLDPLGFYFTLLVTILWTLLNISLHVAIGVALALALREPFLKLRGLYRVLLIIPWAVPNYITALIWKGMFNRQFGAVNGLLTWLGLEPVAWFSSFATALAANVTTNVWLGFPFMMVVTLGHLAGIPTELEEAAMLDGATRFQRLRHIVLPLLMPAMLPSVLLGAVWTFNMFNVVFLVSGGEPDGATDILITQAYRWAFARGHRYGYAAAYAVLIFLVLLLQTALMRRASDTDRGR